MQVPGEQQVRLSPALTANTKEASRYCPEDYGHSTGTKPPEALEEAFETREEAALSDCSARRTPNALREFLGCLTV